MYESNNITVFDLETNGLLPAVSKIHCIVTQGINDDEGILITEGIKCPTGIVCGHNIIGYDIPVMQHLGIDISGITGIIDTMILSQLFYPTQYLSTLDHKIIKKSGITAMPSKLIGSHSLEAWGYRLKENKGEFGKDTDWAAYSDEMGTYCLQDVNVNVKLMKHFLKRYQAAPTDALKMEMDFAKHMQQQQTTGVAFDSEAAVSLYAQLCGEREAIRLHVNSLHDGWYTEMKTPAYYEILYDGDVHRATSKREVLNEAKLVKKPGDTLKYLTSLITDGALRMKHEEFNAGSRNHILRMFKEKYNYEPTVFTQAGNAVMSSEVLKGLVYPEAVELLKLFDINKIIGMLAEGKQAWLKLVAEDGRLHGRVKTVGTRTRRCSHVAPNLAQVPAHSEVGAECRKLFTVPDGYKLVGADASGLELRMLSHYLHRYDGGAYTAEVLDGDIHTVNQTAAGLPTRDAAKTFIYSFLYGCGDELMGKQVGKGAAAGRALKKRFLKATPAIAQLQAAVVKEFEATKGWITSLDGLRVFNPSKHAALNTLLQSAGAIIMKRAAVIFMKMLEAAKVAPDVASLVLNVHDELQVQVLDEDELPDAIGKMLVEAMLAAGKYYKMNIPTDGAYKIGTTWGETH